ncbi:LPXTG cell wall anchor domain-containing protein [Streptomyces sp. NPDC096132]|uniref:LPXTG cell wall anchor domain-containing protein n=1 Tax=Streptomyces sp. NPDC096132 TaxID=3366075 RepID=UPI003824EEDD
MKLRRTLVTAAATAALVPYALLSAPAAFAEETGSPSASSSESQTASASASDTSSPSGSASDTSSPSSSESQTGSASGSPSGSASQSSSSSASSSASESSTADESDAPFDPVTDCKSIDWDDDLSATIKGLPSKIVAGSGWHGFKYTVENNTGTDLKNVYMATYLEYEDEDVDDWLSDGLAVIQVKEDGKWTNAYQESFEDGAGGSVNISSSFVGLLDELEKDTSATFDLRVKVEASAPAGSSVALSEAVYAGENADCHLGGAVYDVQILAAGSDSGGSDDATPNGDKPTDTKPQGSAKPISGSLASTGSDSSLPVIGLVGGAAVVAGAGAVLAVRRRKTGAHA